MSIEAITPSPIFKTITPSDTKVLNPAPSSLYATSTGDLTLMDSTGNIEVIPVVASQTIAFRPSKVMVTATNGATCVGMYSYNHQYNTPFTQYSE